MPLSQITSLFRKYLLPGACVVAALYGAWQLIGSNPAPEPQNWRRMGLDAAAAVRVEAVKLGSLDVQLKSIGTVTPLNTVTVRSRVNGVLESINFEEGANVQQGDLLAVIDPLPYRAQLEQAEGQLQQNTAKLENARTDLALYEDLWQQDSIARQQLSSQRALVRELEGTVRANQAEVQDAQLQLSWTRIQAPIPGKLGLRRIDQGNLVTSSDAEGLVSITQLQPIAVNFTVPERDVLALRRAFGGDTALQVTVFDRDEREVLATGVLTTLDNQIDTTTGTLRVRARFDNTDDALFPNQFVNVQLRLHTLESRVTIPSDAVQYGTDHSYVYVVEEGKSFVREITLGVSSGDRVAVTNGLRPGELVVLEGLDRLRDGREVSISGGADDTIVSSSETTPADREARGERPPGGDRGRAPRAPDPG